MGNVVSRDVTIDYESLQGCINAIIAALKRERDLMGHLRSRRDKFGMYVEKKMSQEYMLKLLTRTNGGFPHFKYVSSTSWTKRAISHWNLSVTNSVNTYMKCPSLYALLKNNNLRRDMCDFVMNLYYEVKGCYRMVIFSYFKTFYITFSLPRGVVYDIFERCGYFEYIHENLCIREPKIFQLPLPPNDLV